MYKIDKDNIKTDNIPLVDELVYAIKKICKTCVLKDEAKALECESLETQKESDIYLLCVEGKVTFRNFEYTLEDLMKIGIPDNILWECYNDNNQIPDKYREALKNTKSKEVLENYIEKNNYYRMLNGIPNYKQEGIVINPYIMPKELKDINVDGYVHELSDSTLDILYHFGVIDKLLDLYPDCKYLNHLGSKSISIYSARVAVDNELLYVTDDLPTEISVRFKEKIEINRVFTKKTIYSDAFKLGSDYYDNFIRIFIIIQTILDLLAEIPDMIIKREVFDIRTIELLFKSNGVDYFHEIPYRYQISMVRNLNKLLKFKSTTRNLVDICSLFGFDNINVFKYYLLRNRTVNKDGSYNFNTKIILNPENGEEVEVEDYDSNYELKFLKVPIEDKADNFLNVLSNHLEYDSIVEGDKYWNGELTHEYVKSTILAKEFNYVQSKYISVDTMYSLSELSFQMVYFYNMVLDDVILEELLTVRVPAINGLGVFKFVDILCYLYALTYEYNNLEDDIITSQTNILHVKGFNFKANMSKLASYVKEKGFTLEELGVSDFKIYKDQLLSYNQLMNIFTNNKNIHDHIVKQMFTADNYDIYKVYSDLYDSLMITELSHEFFRLKDGRIAKSYTEFLKERDVILYNSLIQIRQSDSVEVKQDTITTIIDATVYELEEFINTKEYKYIFSHLPAVSAEAIKKYIYTVVNFYKSYKIDILSINTVYVFDDKLENKIKCIDNMLINRYYDRVDNVDVLDTIRKWIASFTYREKIELIDKIYINISRDGTIDLRTVLNIIDKIKKNTSTKYTENICVYDSMKILKRYK